MMPVWPVGFARIAAAAILAAAFSASTAALAADDQLVASVVVSRHGVRSPIAGHAQLESIAADPWPSWPVPPGHLTPRGAELARLLGVYYRGYYAERGLFPAEGCPAPAPVFAWADVDQRTRVTAQSLLDGLFPGCNLKPGYLVGAKVDPLFHPTRAGLCRIDPERARQDVLRRAGGSLTRLQARFRPELSAMQRALECCRPELCRASGVPARCALGDVRAAMSGTRDGSGFRLSGPLAISSTAAEIFLLEYAQGFPTDEVAWGRAATPQAMRPLLRLHTLLLDLMYRTPYLAARQGSALLQKILAALQRASGPEGAAAPKLTLIVGHDTNLFEIGGMLGLHWSLPGYLPDQTPPGGALHFELLRKARNGGYAVRVVYIAQTLDQMRQASALDHAHPPEQATVTIRGCKADAEGACPWPAFAALARRAIDPGCVGPAGAKEP